MCEKALKLSNVVGENTILNFYSTKSPKTGYFKANKQENMQKKN